MALKKKPVVRKNRSRRKGRREAGRFRRFFSAACMSMLVTFSVASGVLNPQWRDTLTAVPVLQSLVQLGDLKLERFDLDRLGLGRLAFYFDRSKPHDYGSVPSAAGVDGYVQTAFSQCSHVFPGQPPIVPVGQSLRELCFSAFAILHSGQSRTPVFVAQRLNRSMLEQAPNIERTDRFYAEARLPKSERAELADYRGSGFSRGHMAPAGDMHTEQAMAQSFSLANMVPQHQRHNAGAWSRIERDTRKYVMRAPGDVYIFTGPVYDTGSETIGDGRVAVPRYVYKLVFDATTKRSWVHWHVHHDDTQAGRPISYEEFVRRTGLHLLPTLATG